MTHASRSTTVATPTSDVHALADALPEVDAPPLKDDSFAAWYALAVLLGVTLLANIDRQMLALAAEPLRVSLGLSDVKLGLLQGIGISLVVGVAAIPLAWCADRFGRRTVLTFCVLLWSVATLACGLAQGFTQLLIATMLLGFGEAALVPIAFGLIPELFHNRKRVLANAVFMTGANLGSAAGIVICGFLIANTGLLRPLLPEAWTHFESWRLGFLAVALPGPLAALLVVSMRTGRGPKPTRVAPVAVDLHQFTRYIQDRAHTLGTFFGGFGFAQLGLTATFAWMPVVATRQFGQSAQDIGSGMGAAIITGILLGVLVGTLAVRRFAARLGALTAMRVSWISFVLAATAALPMLFATHAWQLYVLIGLQASLVMAAANLLPTALQDLSPPDMRSRIASLYTVITVLLTTLGPIAVGYVSDQLSNRTDGLLVALVSVVVGSLLLGAMLVRRAEDGFVELADTLRAGRLPVDVPISI